MSSSWITAWSLFSVIHPLDSVAQSTADCALSQTRLSFSLDISQFTIKDSLLSLVGGCLFLASGSFCLDYNSWALGDKWDIATALGSLAIITGG